jgi:tRNA(Ile)-lysidine synthase
VNPPVAKVLETALARTLEALPSNLSLAVGLSGGPDSSAMAICLDRGLPPDRLLLFHVHHGLSEQADTWQAKAQALADLLKRPLYVRRVDVDLDAGLGLEGAARQARRAALKDLASEHQVDAMLLAHHQQDQAETVLMRLLRGSGVQGLAAMRAITHEAGLTWVRPWLDVSRHQILDYLRAFSERTGWTPVDDPSNHDATLARGTLRSQVLPAIETHWPAWQGSLSRHAKQAAQASRLLERYGQRLVHELRCDVTPTDPGQPTLVAPVLSLQKWRALDPDEQVLALRVWMSDANATMPTEKRVNELVRQLNQVHALGHDRQLKWQQQDAEVLCIRGQLHLRVKL